MKREMIEREQPKLVKFEAKGDFACGVLSAAAPVYIPDGNGGEVRRMQYTVLDDDGQAYQFLGNWDINVKLRATDIGRYVQVTYKSDDAEAGKNGNAMKVFEVKIEKPKGSAAPKLPPSSGEKIDRVKITDDDIPF